ncbi:MAG TPA: hypothetical protein VKG38_04315 [Solirubrobacteraceae bacterium]|nr:hypothetical protein [Solirubrobacteraceae bacterium]
MKRMRTFAVCLVAVCAASAVVATTASASAPEIGRCIKVAAKTGKYSSATCTTAKAGGSYEWLPGAEKKKFTTKGGIGILETAGGTAVGCKTETSGGEFNTPKTVTGIVVTFKECESAGLKCKTKETGEGELVTKELEGELGIESKKIVNGKETIKLALDLFPAGKTGLFIEFSCGPLSVKVQGSVLVNVLDDKMESALTLKYSAKHAKQKPEGFEGLPKDILESSINGHPFEQSGQTITTVQTGEEKLEANAFV